MKNWFKNIAIATALVGCCSTVSLAQDAQNRRGPGGGQRDPEEMRQRMTERMREQFGVTDDAEWKVIEGKIQKVTEARRATGGGFGGGMAFGARRGGPGGPGGDGERGGDRGGEGRRGFGGPGGEPSPEVEDLRKAVDAKASADEIKTKLAKVRETRKANEAKLEAAQEDLCKVLTVRQEAVAVMMGLVK
ncbi:MAG: hypothetical protein ACXW3Z_12790 [Limisphaerales bacterium]